MNKSKLKTYAPQARKDFIAAVTARANLLGLSEAGGKLEVAPGERKGDLAIIAGREWPVKVYEQRERLIKHIQTAGFSQTMEAVAYTWFNRFAALRYMEIHDYLDHGHRVLSNRAGGMPEILNHATELELPGFNKTKAVELKLAGNKDGELYKMLLVTQCNALSTAMPFLFERIADETELLLPDNLLRTDSIIAKLVDSIPEEDWQEVEIIGWLYQFYISEKKDEVIGKVVKSEDIPAATQLFTPNWIVQYLVQNSVGRLWLMANPASTLKSQWPYYIEPAEQTPEVQAQLDALIQTRIQEDSPRPQAGEGLGERVIGATLNPETITVLDPACGSGHILVVAYDVLKAIYLERGYQLRAIPRLILEKNLYGLDIDDRAAQLAGFALLMKARADDRRLFDNPPKLNVLALQESKGLDADEIIKALNTVRAEPVEAQSIRQLIDTFVHAKTFGSLIQIPPELNAQLATLAGDLQQAIQNGDLYAKAAAQDLLPLVAQARVLGMQFDAVVANPPYMGSKYHTPAVKDFLETFYPGFEKDLFAAFALRNSKFGKGSAEIAVMSSNVWMFLSSYVDMRAWIIDKMSLNSLVHLSNSGFDGATVFVCAFTFSNCKLENSSGSFIRLTDFSKPSDQGPKTLEAIQNKDCSWFYRSRPADYRKIPGAPIAYWLSHESFDVFKNYPSLGSIGDARMGLATGNNSKYVRLWHECDIQKIGFKVKNRHEAKLGQWRWFPYSKGGPFRKWYGNNEYVVDWFNDGQEMQTARHPSGRIWAHNFNLDYLFRDSITWSDVTSGSLSSRFNGVGFLFDGSGTSAFFGKESEKLAALGFLNSRFGRDLSKVLNPTLHFQTGDFRNFPYSSKLAEHQYIDKVKQAIALAKEDWDSFENSWEFQSPSFLIGEKFELGWQQWRTLSQTRIRSLSDIEFDTERDVAVAFGMNPNLVVRDDEENVTLARADREKDCQRLISYAIGCMMGRYSLDRPGLIYAHAGNVDFDKIYYGADTAPPFVKGGLGGISALPTESESQKQIQKQIPPNPPFSKGGTEGATFSNEGAFAPDADGIVPLTDELWFEDDAANRIREFLLAVWGVETLEENLAWLAESLGKKGNDTPIETIRRYLSGSFYKDHLQTYKKRPIYWLFSSGKQGAFQALVYLHRYHEGTLARMRSEYVVPLTGKIQSRIEMLTKDAEAATSTAARNKLNKEIEGLRKKHVELLSYDEKLRHYADMRIKLDLDDGVKVNYGKFGDLLSDVKSVTGGKDEE